MIFYGMMLSKFRLGICEPVSPASPFDCGRGTGFCSFMSSGSEHLTSLLASAGGRLLMPRDEGEQVLGALCNWKSALFGDKEKKGRTSKVQDILLITFLSSDRLLVLSPLSSKNPRDLFTFFPFHLSQCLPPFKVSVLKLTRDGMKSFHFSIFFYFSR